MTRSIVRRKPAHRLRIAALGLGSTLAALSAASAQTPAAATGETAAPERVVITGSLIPTAAEVGAAPVTTVDAAAVGRTGVDDPQVVLEKSDPSFSGGGNIGSTNASVNSGATNGGSAVSLRGLPTLVLLNGRRIADSAALAAGGAKFADVNLFPAALIKRIEVLKDGASAIYGSDAVGGVVNILLNDDFQGAAFSGRYGFAEKGDITDQRYSGLAGFGDDKTRIVVAAQYQENDPIFNTQRDWAQSMQLRNPFSFETPYAVRTNVSSNFGGNTSVGVSAAAGASGSASIVTGLPANATVAFGPAVVFNAGQTVPGGQGAVGTGTPVGSIVVPTNPATGQQVFNRTQLTATGAYKTGNNYLDLTPFLGITLDQNRTNAYGSVERDIFEKHLTVFGDFLYSKNYSQSYLAPQPVATNSSANIEQNEFIPNGSPYNPFASDIGFEQGALPPGTNLVVKNRFLSAPRIFRNDTEFYRIVAGLRGEIIKDYNYEVAFNHSEDQINFKNFNLVRADLLNEAIAGGYNADGSAAPATFNANGTVATPAGAYSKIEGVIYPALNPFAYNNPVATERAILGTDIRDQQSKLTVIDGKITGFPVTLPAGQLGFAVGGEYRREELRLNNSVENFVASVPAQNVQVGRDIEAGYLELSIPVIGSQQKVPGVYSFDIDAAVRYENYEGTGDTWSPKVSVVYRPIIDVAVRGTFTTSFNAPSLIDTSLPPGTGFTGAVNLGAGYAEQANSFSQGNPNLGPSRTDTYSAGVVLSPHQVPGLTLSGDFFHVEQHNVISSINTATAINDVNTNGPSSYYSQFVHFGSFAGPQVTAPGQIQGNAPNYFVVAIPDNNRNARLAGVDFTANYDHDFGKFGGITLGLNGTYYLQYKQNDYRGGRNYDTIGLYLGQADQVPQYRLVPYFEYRYGGASASALMNYIPSTRDVVSFDPSLLSSYYDTGFQGGGKLPKIRDYYDIDLTFSYEFGLHKPVAADVTPTPSPKDGKDGKDSKVVTSKEVVKQRMAFNLLDGLKLTFGINNVTNARPPLIPDSVDSTNTDASIYDPYQRYYYFVVSKKF